MVLDRKDTKLLQNGKKFTKANAWPKEKDKARNKPAEQFSKEVFWVVPE